MSVLTPKRKRDRLRRRFFLSLVALLTTQFRLIFRLLASRFLAGQIAQPATERCRCQTVLTAILRPAEPAPTPGFNVNQPPGLPRLVLEMSQSHRSSSTLRRSPTCRAITLRIRGAETGRLRADHGRGRQDKSAACGRAHVIGWIGDFRHLAGPTGWRLHQKYQDFQCAKRHPVIGECTLSNGNAGRRLRPAARPHPSRHPGRQATEELR
jgi:hypothetical protein